MAVLIKDKNNLFINPYNFVSMTSEVKRDYKIEAEMSGYISCTLKVKDTLIIPDTYPVVKASDNQGATYNFYNVKGTPIIPGSEIRGCIRSVFEAVTPSCFSVTNDNILSARLPRPSGNDVPKTGILEKHNGKWQIFEAAYRNTEGTYEEYENGKHCDSQREWLTPPQDKTGKAYRNTYFYKGELTEVICTDKDVDRFITSLDIYVQNKKDKKDLERITKIVNKIKNTLSKMKEQNDSDLNVPVFYTVSADNTLEYFSFAQIGRKVFKNTVTDFLDKHTKCSGADGYCPACSLFGTLGLASRLRFEDAVSAKGEINISKDYIVLPELSSPKISSTEFYSIRGDKKHDVRMWGYDDQGVALRGRKFYFHSKPALNENEFGKRQIKSKAVEENSIFNFKLYFDKITLIELRQLLWVLTFGENRIDGKMMHKIGAGRPVGFGSVKIAVDHIMLRKFDNENFKYFVEEKCFDDYFENNSAAEDSFSEKKALDDMKRIANYDFLLKPKEYKVSYPIANDGRNNKNSAASHQWFTSNRASRGPEGDKKIYFVDILPELSDNPDNLQLYAYKPVYGKKTNSKKHRNGGYKNGWNN